MPGTLSLVVTRRCNLECGYCPVDKRAVDLDPAVAVAEVRAFATAGGSLVRLTGGEPTLHWAAVEAVLGEVERQRDAGRSMRAELCTNGVALDATQVRWLDRDWIDVVISVDGPPGAQQASGRAAIPALEELLALRGLWVTQTIAPQQAPRLLDHFLYLWEFGVRRFNLLPVFYIAWDTRALGVLEEGLAGVAEFLAPRVATGEVRVRNLERIGAVPLYNDDTTVDADGEVYRTNLVLTDSVTAPLLDDLRRREDGLAVLPLDLRRRLQALLPFAVRRSNTRVDAILSRFVRAVRRGDSGDFPRRPAAAATPPARPRPSRLELHLSYECTNRCAFCSEATRMDRWQQHPVRATEVRRAIRSHAAAGGEHVLLTGGEPTIHPAFLYGLELARSRGLRTAVGTNGTRLADPLFAARALPLLDELSLSIHGPGAAVHDRETGHRGSFAELRVARENVARLRPALTVAANTVVTRSNVDQLESMIDLCVEWSLARLLVSNVAPEGRAAEDYAAVVVPLWRWRTLAPAMAERARAAGVAVRFFGLPLCVLGTARMKSNDLHYDPRVTVERSRGARGTVRMGNVATFLPRRGRRQPPACRGCRFRAVCGGVFGAYLDAHGDGEVQAIRD